MGFRTRLSDGLSTTRTFLKRTSKDIGTGLKLGLRIASSTGQALNKVQKVIDRNKDLIDDKYQVVQRTKQQVSRVYETLDKLNTASDIFQSILS